MNAVSPFNIRFRDRKKKREAGSEFALKNSAALMLCKREDYLLVLLKSV